MKNAKAALGNLLFYSCIVTICLSYYFGNHSLLPVTYGLLGGYIWRVFAESLEEEYEKKHPKP